MARVDGHARRRVAHNRQVGVNAHTHSRTHVRTHAPLGSVVDVFRIAGQRPRAWHCRAYRRAVRAVPSAEMRRAHLAAAQSHAGLAAMRNAHAWHAALPVSVRACVCVRVCVC
jgi:hypothetical protein